MMNTIKNFLSNNYVMILAVVLLVALLGGAAALILPTAEQAAGESNCIHGRYRYISTSADENGNAVYNFRCIDCRATIRETPSTSSFVLNKPTIENGVVTMNTPWEVGAYYTVDDTTTYKPFTVMSSNNWFSNEGTLWKDTTGIRITNTLVNMPTTPVGNAAITFTAEKDCYIRPQFSLFKHDKADKSAEFAIFVNGERAYPTDGNVPIEAASLNTEIQEDLNDVFADTWIGLSKGDTISFVVCYAGVNSAEFNVYPYVEVLTHSPNK